MKATVINLLHRTDRLSRFMAEAKTMHLEVERFDAYSKPTAVIGNGRSHFEVLSSGARFIFEDDIFFEPYAWDIFNRSIQQLPADWDILYLTGNVQEQLNRYSENLYRCTFAWGSCAILYSEKGAKFVLENYDPMALPFTIYDEWLRVQSAKDLQAYIVSPIIAWTYAGISDVNGYYSDYLKVMQHNALFYMQ